MDSFMVGEMRSNQMSDKRYSVVIRAASMGLYRIQVTDMRRPDPFAPRHHGTVAEEMLTNSTQLMRDIALQLALAENPVTTCRLLKKKHPCDFPGGVPCLVDEKAWKKIEGR